MGLGVKNFENVSDATRKAMQSNKGKNTKPEMLVRRLVHAMGYRYRLHRRDLPGCPDMVFGSKQAVIEIRGCFWHRHPGCRLAYLPKTRRDFWQGKFDRNVERDARNRQALENAGWRMLVVWECETRNVKVLMERLTCFLEPETDATLRN